MNVPQPLSVTVLGITWDLYDVEFESPDGRFSVYLYAISDDHAQLQLDALRETGTLTGRVLGVYREH